VGIFWFFDGALLIDKASLSEAEPYGNHLTHPRSHNDVWEEYQRIGKVPADVGYDEPPRGRAMFDRTTETFTLLADRCILSRRDLLTQIKSELNLPRATKIGTDGHYRCFHCLYGKENEKD
jgi:hypothetical protein